MWTISADILVVTVMDTTWVAAFRSAVLSPRESWQLKPGRSFADVTLRQVLHLDGGGEGLRVRLTNRYGTQPLAVGEARVAVRTTGSEIDPASDREVTFDGCGDVVVPAGEEVLSDPVDLAVGASDDLALSLFLPEETGLATYSIVPLETGFVAQGNAASAPSLPGAEEVDARFFVAGVDVLAPVGTRIAVAFGDSWIEGAATTSDTNRRPTNLLNARLERGWIVNQGISGNRLLVDVAGEHGLSRFDRDVLAVPGVTHVLFHFGINDLGLPGISGLPPARAEDLIAGFAELARRAHEAGLSVTAATIGPFADAIYEGIDSPEGREIRLRVNEWIRTSREFDAVADFARAVEDPERPDFLRPAFDSGDHMHCNDAGAEALAGAVDVTCFGL
jgi:lysophospholipase L1-like esterase